MPKLPRFARFCAAALLVVFPRLALAVCQVVAVASVAPADSGGAKNTQISYVTAPAQGAPLNNEGLTERLNDLLIFDDAALPFCFAASTTFTITYSAPITQPASLSDLSANVDVFDSALPNGLLVTASGAISSGQTTLTLAITRSGTAGNLTIGASGAALRVKNLRADVTSITALQKVIATAASSNSGALAATARIVGNVLKTINAASLTAGAGEQNAGKTLTSAASFTITEGFGSAFRAAGASGVLGDAPTSATSLVFDAANTIPPGVTVTFPASITTSASAGAAGVIFTLRAPTSCVGPATCVAIYDTTANASAISSLTVVTAANPRTGETSTAAIGVAIGNSSGAGTATLHAFFGPAAAAGSFNDDVSAGAVPRYVANNGAGGVTRNIFSGTWFTVSPSGPILLLSTTTLSFGDQNVGTLSAAQSVIVTNTGTSALTIASVTSSDANFLVMNGCPVSLAPSTSCQIGTRFAPQTAGAKAGAIMIFDNTAGAPHAITVSGNGVGVNPQPTLVSLDPAVVAAGVAGFTLRVNGSGFVPQSEVRWNGTVRPTLYESATVVSASIGAADVATAGIASVTVFTPAPGGGTSNSLTLSIGANPLTTSPFNYFLPHAVSGSGYVTKITIVNNGATQNAVTLHWVSQQGVLLDRFDYVLAAGAAQRVETPESERFGDPLVKWAIVGTQMPAAVNVFFEYVATPGGPVTTAVGYDARPPGKDFSIPVEFEPARSNTVSARTMGLAVANTTGASNTVTLTLLDSTGGVVAVHGLTLAPFAQTSIDLGMLPAFKSKLPATNFQGSLTISGTQELVTAAIFDDFGPFALVPATPGKAK